MKIDLFYNDAPHQIEVDDDSCRFRQIMGDHNLTLNFSLAKYVEIPIGAYCTFEEQVYTLYKPANYVKSGTRKYKYTLLLESEEVKSRKWMFRNPNDGKLKFSLTGKPIDFLEMLVANLNMRDPGWKVGRCIAGNEKSMAFSHELCDAVGKRIAGEYQTELEYDGKVVSLNRIEYNKANSLPLAYGKGFIPGTKRDSEDVYPIDNLYVQGDSRNINYSKYAPDGTNHSDTLLLPLAQHIWYDGGSFYNYTAATQKWSLFDEENNTWSACDEPENVREYVTAPDGQSLKRADKETTDFESSVDCSDVYPSRIGTITEVIPIKTIDNTGDQAFVYDFIDNTIPQGLNYKECLIGADEMTVLFQSGMLAGREFGVSYNHAERRFAIKPSEQDGFTMPGGVYVPKEGDKYAVFGIQLPNAYLCDDATKTGASWDMFRYAVKYMFDNEEPKVTYTGELDGIYAQANWPDLAGKIVLGGYVRLDDPELKEAALVRITSIKEFLNKPHKPKIELSNITSSGGFMQRIGKLEAEEVIAEDNKKEVKAYTKRRFRDAKETMTMLEKAFDHFSGSIQPASIQTMQLLAGDESLQFQFVKASGMDADKDFAVIYDEEAKELKVSGGLPSEFCRLQHKTLGINDLSSYTDAAYKSWVLEPFVSEKLGGENAGKSYYLYAKCRKAGATSMTDYDRFVLREEKQSFDGDSDYYYMLVGILNSEYAGTRNYVSMYGYTEILPGRINTDKIVSTDGETYFDLKKGTIGGQIEFKDKTGVTQTFIKGGHINTDFIDAYQITARKLEVSNNTGKVTILPETGLQLLKYDGSGTNYTKTADFNGEEKGSLSEIIPQNISEITISEKIVTPTTTKQTATMALGQVSGSYASPVQVTFPAIWLIESGDGSLRIPKWITSTPAVSYSTRSVATMYFNGKAVATLDMSHEFKRGIDSEPYYQYVAIGGNVSCVAASTVETITSNVAGNVKVTFDYQQVYSSWPAGTLEDLQYNVHAKFSDNIFPSITSQLLKVGKAALNATFFGNGLIFSKATDQYVGMMATKNNGTQFEIRSGDAGVKIGSGGIEQRKKEGGWDSSGVLLGLSVRYDGGIKTSFGVKDHSLVGAIKTATGTYRIRHDIGHENYVVNAIAINGAWNADRVLHVLSCTSQYVYIQCTAYNNQGFDTDFFITIFGTMSA